MWLAVMIRGRRRDAQDTRVAGCAAAGLGQNQFTSWLVGALGQTTASVKIFRLIGRLCEQPKRGNGACCDFASAVGDALWRRA